VTLFPLVRAKTSRMGERTEGTSRRVVVTGMGLVSPVGNDVAASWEAMLAGKSGGATVTPSMRRTTFRAASV
jgi:3-oxoacyl-(acyl-carrier-protein) synthase